MEVKVYAIMDVKAGQFVETFKAPNNAVALRLFQDVGENPSSVYSKHPEDFTLYELATFNPDTGRFSNGEAPKNLGNLLMLVPSAEQA